MDEQLLQKTGLSESEAKVYISLIKAGSCKAGKIAKEIHYNRTTIYKALESLIQKGLASFVIKENRKYFEASSPHILVDNIKKEEQVLKDKKKQIEEYLPELSKLFEES